MLENIGKLLFITPSSKTDSNPEALLEYLEKNHDEIVKKLLTHGTIIFRGFRLNSAEIFSKCVKACKLGEFFNYTGGTSPRTRLADGIYTSTEAPPNMWIDSHNEMSYSPIFPNNVYFYCHQPAVDAGATPIVDARLVYQNLDSALREKLEQHGLLYTRFYFEKSFRMQMLSKLNPVFIPWTKSFGTSDRSLIEKKLKEENYDFEWLNNQQGLRTFTKLPAFRAHPITKELVWFNQSNLFNNFFNVYYNTTLGRKYSWVFRHFLLRPEYLPCTTRLGNGDDLKKDEIIHIMDTIQKNLIIEPWQQGDFMLIDNYLCMHGRQPFKGPRSIMVSLTS